MTIDENPTNFVYRCDVCGMSKTGDSAEMPPPGFATLLVRRGKGVGHVAHLCVGSCLGIAAENMAEGRTPCGEVVQ